MLFRVRLLCLVILAGLASKLEAHRWSSTQTGSNTVASPSAQHSSLEQDSGRHLDWEDSRSDEERQWGDEENDKSNRKDKEYQVEHEIHQSDNGIDCSMFQHLDDPPPECLPDSSQGLTRPPPSDEPPPEGSDGYRPKPPSPPVQLQASLGMAYELRRMEVLTEVVSRVMTFLLNRYAPFDVYYFTGRYYQRGQRYLSPFRPQRDQAKYHVDPIYPSTLPSANGSDPFDVELEQRVKQLVQSWNATLFAGNTSRHLSFESDDEDRPRLIELFHNFTSLELVDKEATGVWYKATVGYIPVWIRQGDPVRNGYVISNVTHLCEFVINATIESGEFFSQVETVADKLIGAIDDSKEGEIEDESPMTGGYPQSGADSETGQIFGDENSSSVAFDPPANGPNSEMDDDSLSDLSLYGVSKVGEEESWSYRGSADNSVKADGASFRYTGPLDPTWGVREWCGLAVCCTTVVIATFLTLCAAIVQRRQTKSKTWGAVFTEDGVNDILQVGWRYHQQNGDTRNVENQQLFLQVYDKSKEGYCDDNSMLLGGVEQKGMGAPSTLPTEMATTNTPDSTRRDSASREDSTSRLPSSTFSASSPDSSQRDHDPRLHQYETSEEGSSARKSTSSRRRSSKSRSRGSSNRKPPSSRSRIRSDGDSRSSTASSSKKSSKRKSITTNYPQGTATGSEVMSDLTTSSVAAASAIGNSNIGEITKVKTTSKSSRHGRPKSSGSQTSVDAKTTHKDSSSNISAKKNKKKKKKEARSEARV